MRGWLNNEFYNIAFSEKEKDNMALFDAKQLKNPRYNTLAGESTVDNVSILSYQEIIKYMPNKQERKAKPTKYAINQGSYINPDGDAAWWLRSPGATAKSPEYIASRGNFGLGRYDNNDVVIGVRPVIWVKTDYLKEIN